MKNIFCAICIAFWLTSPTFAFDNKKSSREELTRFEKEVRLNGNDPVSHYNLASVYQGLGKRERAIAEYKFALKIDPNFSEAHNNLGSVYFELGRNEEAIGEYRKALDLFPNYPEAHFGLGLSYYLKNEEAKALTHFQRAEELFDRSNELENSQQVARILTIIKAKARVGKDVL